MKVDQPHTPIALGMPTSPTTLYIPITVTVDENITSYTTLQAKGLRQQDPEISL